LLTLRSLAVVGTLAAIVPAAGAQQGHPEPGRPAAGFNLSRLEGGQLELAELRGRPVVINFWATWCAPCRTEMPLLISAWRDNRRLGLEIVAVNLTDQERRKDVLRFVQQMGVPFPVVLDEHGRVRERYGLVSLPTTVFVDSVGIVQTLHSGPLSGADLAKGLATILPTAKLPSATSDSLK
jgi:cytochrome c biogenesis protein CcmG, thiol:disulfide interchange protein DsbE